MKNQSKNLIRQLGAISNTALVSFALLLVFVSSGGTALAFQWSDWNLSSHTKQALSLFDASDLILDLASIPQDLLTAYARFNLKQEQKLLTELGIRNYELGIREEKVAGNVILNEVKDLSQGSDSSLIAQNDKVVTQQITQVIREINNYTVKASLTESELVDLVSSSQTLKDMLKGSKGDKGEKGDPGVTVGYTLPTSTNTNSMGSIAGFTHLGAQDLSVQTLNVSNNATFNSVTLTSCTGCNSSWSSITNPSANLSLTMGANTTTLTYNAATGASNLFNLTDTASNTGTGYLLNLTTGTGSTLKPLRISAAGSDALTINNTGSVNIATVGPHAVGGATDSSYQLRLRGTFTGPLAASPAALAVTTTVAAGDAGVNIIGSYFSQTLQAFSSGNHAVLAGVMIEAPVVTAGVATVTDAATFKINAAPTATVTGANYALWVDGGLSRFDGDIALDTSTSYIRTTTSDGSDTKYIGLAGGGAGDSSARGGLIRVFGNENASQPGQVEIIPGNVSGGKFTVFASGLGAEALGIDYLTGNTTLSQDLVFSTNKVIRRNTADGSDSGSINIMGGGAVGQNRGAYRSYYGNEASQPGRIIDFLGNVSGASYQLIRNDGTAALAFEGSDGSAAFNTTGSGATRAWIFTNSSAGGGAGAGGIMVNYTGGAPNGVGNEFFYAQDTSGQKFTVRSNGGIANFSANNVNLSDERMKNLFGDAPSELERFSQLKFVLGEYKDNPLTIKDVMLTAQQVQTVYPELVTIFDYEKGTLGIREGALALRAYKVIQDLNLYLEGIAGITAPLPGTASESFITSFFTNLFSKITTWLADAANGITDIFAETFHAKDKLCINDTCVTESQLQTLLQNAGSGNGSVAGESTETAGSVQSEAGSETQESTNSHPELDSGSSPSYLDSGSESGMTETDPSSTTEVGTQDDIVSEPTAETAPETQPEVTTSEETTP